MRKMNGEDSARGGEGVKNKPVEIENIISNLSKKYIEEIKAKVVNTGINQYIEFENRIAGFKDGETLEYRACQDGTAVIVRKI